MAETSIHYKVSFPEPQAHYVQVDMEISGLQQDSLLLKMPVWTPGSYLVREFSRHIESFEARAGKDLLECKKKNKNSWMIHTKDCSTITVSYLLYAFELTVRTSFVDADKAYLNGTSIFVYADEFKQLPVTVEFKPSKEWQQISTGLEAKGNNKWVRTAPNYDVLVDCPILIGSQEVFQFRAEGVDHTVAIDGGGNYDVEQLKKDLAKVTEVCTPIFGGNPNDHYTYIVLNTANSYGGLEHLNSTSLIYRRNDYQDREKYNTFLSLAIHEYFHLWNVKRLRPIELGPFDYDNENYTTLLWVAEGFTSYYDEYLMSRAGFVSAQEYLRMMAKTFEYCEKTPGTQVQSLSDASFDAWIKFYRRNENHHNCCTSYYQKGAVIASLLDLSIRHETKGKRSLDDVMRLMYQRYYVEEKRGFTNAELKSTIEEVSGVDYTKFFAEYVDGTEPVDYDKFLSFVGLKTEIRFKEHVSYIGVFIPSDEYIVKRVRRNTPAWNAGINVNDELLAINGQRIMGKFNDFLQLFPVDSEIEVLLNRQGLLKTIKLKLVNDPNSKFSIVKRDDATELQKQLYKSWLGEEF